MKPHEMTSNTHARTCVWARRCAQDIINALDQFDRYSTLWDVAREAEMVEFMARNPETSDFEQKIVYYEQLEQQLDVDLECLNVGPVAIFTGVCNVLCSSTHCRQVIHVRLFVIR
jgi:hypothetical protein